LSDTAELTTNVDNVTSTLDGLAPASGGGTTTFLRADGTWAAPVSGTTAILYTLASDEATAASTTPISLTGLEFTFDANSTYAFRFIGNVSPAAATTGCGFQLLIS
jgi:hypothetical protein